MQGRELTARSLVVYIHVLLQHASMFIVDLHVLLQHARALGFHIRVDKTIPYSMCSCNMVQLIPVILMARVLTAYAFPVWHALEVSPSSGSNVP